MPPSSRQTPPSIPGYRIERPLGEGGMATAWLAVQLSLGREVALKVLDPMLAADAGFVERFVREARVLASLRHRNIVAIHEIGVADGLPYLAMEFLHQGSILPLCGQCDAATALRCVREIGDGLGHAHARGIIHRDVKPENILRGEDGGFVLGDFGIARVANAGALAAPTAPGLAFGTPAYMAPERWRDAAVDGRSDFYSLGCVLHALLTARPPFSASEQVALGHKHLNDPIPLLPQPFEALQGLLARLLAKDPADRYPDAAALAAHVQVLEREIDSGQARSGGETRLLAEWPFGSGERLLAPEPPRAPPESAANPRSRRVPLVLGLGATSVVLVAALAHWASDDGVQAPSFSPPVAVLPLRADDRDDDLVRLAGVVSEDLTSLLARQPGMQVVAHTSVLAVSEQERDARELARRLRVEILVDGTVRRTTDGAIQMQIHLVDGTAGTQFWSTDATARSDEIWTAINQATRELARRLVPEAQAAPLSVAVSGTQAANAAYLRGRQLMGGAASPEDLVAARAAFDDALVADPDFAPAETARCRVGLRIAMRNRSASDFDRASSACDRASRLAPDSPDVTLSQGDLQLALREPAKALAAYLRVVDDPALRTDALLGLARAQAALGQNGAAEDAYRRAQALLPGYWRVHYELGYLYLSLARYDEAIEAYRTALQLGGTIPQVYNNLGAAFVYRGRLEEAEAAYETSLRRSPTHAALSNLGTIKFMLGKAGEAADRYREALSLEPDDYRMVGYLADALLTSRGGDDDEVRRHYANAAAKADEYLRRNPGAVDAQAERAWYWANLGRLDEAARAARALADVPQDDPRTLTRIAAVLGRAGEREAAVGLLRRARERGYQELMITHAPWLRDIDPLPAAGALR
jgi:serine/threonine protein kinase/Flp pilus assembly protein TadD/TolB-like protein